MAEAGKAAESEGRKRGAAAAAAAQREAAETVVPGSKARSEQGAGSERREEQAVRGSRAAEGSSPHCVDATQPHTHSGVCTQGQGVKSEHWQQLADVYASKVMLVCCVCLCLSAVRVS